MSSLVNNIYLFAILHTIGCQHEMHVALYLVSLERQFIFLLATHVAWLGVPSIPDKGKKLSTNQPLIVSGLRSDSTY